MLIQRTIQVASSEEGWKATCEHCVEDMVADTESEAIALAKQHAAGLPRGIISKIVLRREGDGLATVWSIDKDPFPPRA